MTITRFAAAVVTTCSPDHAVGRPCRRTLLRGGGVHDRAGGVAVHVRVDGHDGRVGVGVGVHYRGGGGDHDTAVSRVTPPSTLILWAAA